MLPYGIIIKENRLTMQQAFMVWQKKFGILKPLQFIKTVFLPLVFMAAVYFAASMFLDKYFTVQSALITVAIYAVFLGIYMYSAAIKTVRDFAVSSKDRRVQIVFKDETVEIVTEFSKEVIYYAEIDLCYEKDFLLTLIFDRGNFPLSISKMNFEKGDYDTVVSILRSKLPGRYEKKGEN